VKVLCYVESFWGELHESTHQATYQPTQMFQEQLFGLLPVSQLCNMGVTARHHTLKAQQHSPMASRPTAAYGYCAARMGGWAGVPLGYRFMQPVAHVSY
jgi:hypothetical protein